MGKDKAVQTVNPAPQARPAKPAEEPRKKADVILEKIDCLLGTTNAIVGGMDKASSNTSYLSRQNSEIFERTLEENAALRQQIKYIAQQSQNVYDKMSEAISSLTKKIDDLQASLDNQKPAYTVDDIVVAVMERINSGELADAVASRIDYDAINDGVEEVFADYFAGEEMENAVETAGVVTAEGSIDADDIARKVADLISEVPVQEIVSADAVATKVAEQLGTGISGIDAEKLGNYIADKIREEGLYAASPSNEIDYEKLSKKIAQKINIDAGRDSRMDYDRLATLIAYKISPECTEDEEIAEMLAVEEDEDSIYADLMAEEEAENATEEYRDERYETEYADGRHTSEYGKTEKGETEYDETTMEEFNYEYLAELIAARMTEPDNMKIIAEKVAESLAVEDEIDVGEIADALAGRLTVESTPVVVTQAKVGPAEIVEIDYDKFSAMVADKLVEREDIVVDEFFDYDRLADLLTERMETPHASEIENAVGGEKVAAVETVEVKIDYDALAGKVAALMPEKDTEIAKIDYDLIAEKVASFIPEKGTEIEKVDYDLMAEKVASFIPEKDTEIEKVDYDLMAEKVAALIPERGVEIDYDVIADKVTEEISAAGEISIDYDLIAKKIVGLLLEPAEREKEETGVVDAAQEIAVDIDYELLSDLIARRISVPSVDIDAEEIATYVSEKIEMPQMPSVTDVIDLTIDYEELSDLIAQKLMDEEYPETDVTETEIEAEYVEEDTAEAEAVDETFQEVDYEILSEVVSAAVRDTVMELGVDYEKIARCIVDYINELDEAPFDDDADLPDEKDADVAAEGEVDYARIGRIVQRGVTRGLENQQNFDELSDKVAKKVVEAIDKMDVDDESMGEEYLDFDFVDYGRVGDIVRDVVTQIYEKNMAETKESVTSECAKLAEEDINAIAELVAQNVAEVMPKEYDMQVDETGCEAIAGAVYERIDKEELARIIVEYLNPAKDEVVERITAVLGEEEKTPVNAAEIDYDAMAQKVAEKISGNKETEIEYRTEIDEESLDKISDIVLEEVKKYIDESGRLEQKVDVVDGTTKEIREMLERGIVLIDDDNAEIYNGQETRHAVKETAEKAPEEASAEPAEEARGDVEEITEEQATSELMGDASAETAEIVPEQPVDEYVEDEEELITISDIVGDIVIDEEDSEAARESVEDVVIIIDQNVPKVRQHAARRDENAPAVDFGSMMRYNRSFISRIIQGTDEVKTFYGRIKTGFLAYRKVNSTLSWGGERFNKGRETVARLKIRGKTLVLYLALNPQEFKETVYHQVDASDIKSVANTPMMVKVKSPLGAKKAIRLIDNLMARRHGIKQNVRDRDYVAMYPYETTEELIEEELIKTTTKPGKGDEE